MQSSGSDENFEKERDRERKREWWNLGIEEDMKLVKR